MYMYSYKRYDSREAWIRRLKCYWNSTMVPRINTYKGEIYEVDFGENVGSEFSGRHLGLVLEDSLSTNDRVLVIPLTTKIKKYNLKYICKYTTITNDKFEAGVAVNEMRYVSKKRFFKKSLILKDCCLNENYLLGYASNLKNKDYVSFTKYNI